MNSRQGLNRREIEKREPEKTMVKINSKDYFLGYDVDDKRPDSELDIWERLCRRWCELAIDPITKKVFPPFPLDWELSAKKMLRASLMMLAEQMEIEEALHDMGIAFEYKKMRGSGTINTISYFDTRWTSNDWKERHTQIVPDDIVVSPEERERTVLYEEIKVLVDRGRLKTESDVVSYFPMANQEILQDIIRGLNIG